MTAERIYTVRGVSGYVALCDDGEYHRLTPAMRILSGALVHDYVPRRIGRGAEDITDTPEGRVILGTANGGGAAPAESSWDLVVKSSASGSYVSARTSGTLEGVYGIRDIETYTVGGVTYRFARHNRDACMRWADDQARRRSARTAADARWGNRGASAQVRVDADVASALLELPEGERRAFASDAIRRALDARTGA